MTTERTFTLSQTELDDMIEGRLGQERRQLKKQYAGQLDALRRELEQERRRRFGARLLRWIFKVT